MRKTECVLAAVEGLTKSFGKRTVLDRVTHSIRSGHHQLITGPSGCGKTTFLRVLALLEPADAGTIRYRDSNVTGYANDPGGAQRRAGISVGYVSQDRDLWPHLTVRDNLLLAFRITKRRAEGEEALAQIADLLGLTDHLDKHPGQLSGGQSQRCAIARCAMHKPDLMLMDESFANLDDGNVRGVLAIVENLAQTGSTIVLVSHRVELPTDLFVIRWDMSGTVTR